LQLPDSLAPGLPSNVAQVADFILIQFGKRAMALVRLLPKARGAGRRANFSKR
jgi:hypothetical protein